MTGGIGLFLIAIGAILLFAVSASVAGISINTIGIILMVVGAIGLLYALMVQSRATDAPADRHRPTSV